jgi:Cof subfamily protein (haloacid dehalogenase superfamily)
VKEISLVAVDLDGTLLTTGGSLAPKGANLLKRAAQRGIYVVLATTRNPDPVRSFCRLLDIDDPIICTNGAQVWGSPEGPVWVYRSISRKVALAIAQLADSHNWEVSTTIGSMTYWRQRPAQALGQIAPQITVVGTNREAIVGDPVRMLVHELEAIEGVHQLCRTRFPDQCHTEIYYEPDGTLHSLCVFAPGATKGTALAMVLERLGVRRQKVMAIGDNVNDLAMFRYAGVRIAMGNAVEEVKRRACAVAPSNDQEGVAWALKEFVLGKSE